MKLARMTVFICVVSMTFCCPVLAKGKGGSKGKGKGGGGKVHFSSPKAQVKVKAAPAPGPAHVKVGHPGKKPWAGVRVHFSHDEQVLIRGIVLHWGLPGHPGHGSHGLPPGLAKKVARGGDLPPGWQKKCVVGWIMPPEIFVHCHPLPTEIAVKLPPPPPGTMVVCVSGKVVRMGKANHEILAVVDID